MVAGLVAIEREAQRVYPDEIADPVKVEWGDSDAYVHRRFVGLCVPSGRQARVASGRWQVPGRSAEGYEFSLVGPHTLRGLASRARKVHPGEPARESHPGAHQEEHIPKHPRKKIPPSQRWHPPSDLIPLFPESIPREVSHAIWEQFFRATRDMIAQRTPHLLHLWDFHAREFRWGLEALDVCEQHRKSGTPLPGRALGQIRLAYDSALAGYGFPGPRRRFKLLLRP